MPCAEERKEWTSDPQKEQVQVEDHLRPSLRSFASCAGIFQQLQFMRRMWLSHDPQIGFDSRERLSIVNDTESLILDVAHFT